MSELKSEKGIVTLRDALSKLQQRVGDVDELYNMSKTLKDKFFNPENRPDEEEVAPSKYNHPGTLAEMFDINSKLIGDRFVQIQNNLHQILSQIE